jgi:glycosyltransferase involved in cell wall biosynthesis
MKLLIVCSRNSGQIAPFILEQGEALERAGVELNYFPIEGKGFRGYLKNRRKLLDKIKTFQPQLIHAHYGLSGLLANTQRRIPVVTTYHGSDINKPNVYPLSRLSMRLSAHNIFVSEKNRAKSGIHSKSSLIPCGVNLNLFLPGSKEQARRVLGLDPDKKLILFAGSFSIAVKNPDLAKTAISFLPDAALLELKEYSREQVVLLLNAVDVILMTSFTEGSPQIIKEAMACNCPVVSVPVGDVPELIKNVPGCYLADYNANDVAEKIKQTLNFGSRTDGRKRILDLGLDGETVAKRILQIYNSL